MVRAITILFVLMAASVVNAQALVLRTTETECTQSGCRQIIGTGACAYIGNIGDRSVYITAAHNVMKARTVNVGYAGQWWGARVVHREYQGNADFAVIETQKISSQRCFEVSDRQPVNGANAEAYGYSQGIYNVRVMRAKIRVNRNGRFFSRIVAKGDSGGPIVVNGQLVGIIKGHDYQNTIYTDSVLIRRRLVSLYGRLPNCRCNPVIIAKEDPPEPMFPDNSDQLAALEGEVSKLREQLDRLSKTKIPVEIIGDENKVISRRLYPLGQTIRFKYKAVDNKDGK